MLAISLQAGLLPAGPPPPHPPPPPPPHRFIIPGRFPAAISKLGLLSRGDRLRPPRAFQEILDHLPSLGRPPPASSDGRGEHQFVLASTPAQVQEALLPRRKKPLRLTVGLCGKEANRGHGIRLRQVLRWLKLAPVDRQSLLQMIRSKMGREGVRQSQRGGQLRTKQTRSQYP